MEVVCIPYSSLQDALKIIKEYRDRGYRRIQDIGGYVYIERKIILN